MVDDCMLKDEKDIIVGSVGRGHISEECWDAVWRSSGSSLAGGNTFSCMRRCLRNCNFIL
jgi:hypothetical protein